MTIEPREERGRGPEEEWSRWRLALPPLCLVASLAAGSFFARQPPEGPGIPHFDKIAHFFIFGLLGTLLFRLLRAPLGASRRWLLAWALALSFGVVDEVLQWFNPARSFDPWDWAMDASGSLLAIAVYRSWGLYRRALEWRIWGRRRSG